MTLRTVAVCSCRALPYYLNFASGVWEKHRKPTDKGNRERGKDRNSRKWLRGPPDQTVFMLSTEALEKHAIEALARGHSPAGSSFSDSGLKRHRVAYNKGLVTQRETRGS